jgi:hypothetical protein
MAGSSPAMTKHHRFVMRGLDRRISLQQQDGRVEPGHDVIWDGRARPGHLPISHWQVTAEFVSIMEKNIATG